MGVFSSNLLLSKTQRMLQATRSSDGRRRRQRRATQLSMIRWTPRNLLCHSRRSSFATRNGLRTTRPYAHRRSWLAGRCLPGASCGTLAGLSATAHTRPGSALGLPRHSWKRDASGAPCCGENGPGRGLCRLRCPRYRRACVRILMGVEVLGARSLRDEYLLSRARALSRAAHISVSYDIARWLRQPGLRQAPSNRAARAKTSQETAGVSTPVSSRSRKKKSRGGIGGQAT